MVAMRSWILLGTLLLAAIISSFVGLWLARSGRLTTVRARATSSPAALTACPTTYPPLPPFDPNNPQTWPRLNRRPLSPGPRPVLDHTGRTRGYVCDIDFTDLVAPPVGDPGYPVTDNRGQVSGYWVRGYGFVDPVSARDPSIIASLKANPLQVIDSNGDLVGAAEWLQREQAGTARTR